MSHIFLATEDRLSEAVGMRLIQECGNGAISVQSIIGHGFGGLRRRMANFVQIADRNVVFLMTDLDENVCVPSLIANWNGDLPRRERLVFRVSVREIEAWILADRINFAGYLGVNARLMPANVEALRDPKGEIVRLASRGARQMRREIVPRVGVIARVGLGYNDTLVRFVNDNWSAEEASRNSESLRRARLRLREAFAQFIGN